MTTLRSDVLVLGGTLSGLVAATYLARTGLRVIVLEEDVQAKRPALLREPFLLSGLDGEGTLARVLRELALPLLDRRDFERDAVALQVALPGARVDIGSEDEALTHELDLFGFAKPDESLAWLDAVTHSADGARAQLWDEPQAPQRRGLARYVPARLQTAARVRAALPEPPARLEPLCTALIDGISPPAGGRGSRAPALLVDSARQGAFRTHDAGRPFLDLFRRRLHALHGEIREVDGFALISDKHDVGVDLPRGQIYARAMVIAVPREPLRRFAQQAGPVPRWLRPGIAPVRFSQRLFRAEPGDIPEGMASRVILAGDAPSGSVQIARHNDPASDRIRWIVFGGPGASELDDANPFGELAPFPSEGLVAIETGPEPEWDIDSNCAGFPESEPAVLSRARPLLAQVGGEAAPGLGLEGEILQARSAAMRLAQRLGARAPVT